MVFSVRFIQSGYNFDFVFDLLNVRNIGKGEPRHRKYKRLKLGGGQSYYRSSE
jgi:hypothetical protein